MITSSNPICGEKIVCVELPQKRISSLESISTPPFPTSLVIDPI